MGEGINLHLSPILFHGAVEGYRILYDEKVQARPHAAIHAVSKETASSRARV